MPVHTVLADTNVYTNVCIHVHASPSDVSFRLIVIRKHVCACMHVVWLDMHAYIYAHLHAQLRVYAYATAAEEISRERAREQSKGGEERERDLPSNFARFHMLTGPDIAHHQSRRPRTRARLPGALTLVLGG